MPKDHPRLCGEKLSFPLPIVSVIGSPPPMRGKVSFTLAADIRRRITPAYAGKSRLRPKVERDHGDHPRLCGEKRIAFTITSVMKGSPPPMRGKVQQGFRRFNHVRITPAYAGKRFSLPAHFPDYPGSPPPMRGKATFSMEPVNSFGITPAYAGKSRRRLFRGERCKDHPRLCGEKVENPVPSRVYEGSPPPMRGKGRYTDQRKDR